MAGLAFSVRDSSHRRHGTTVQTLWYLLLREAFVTLIEERAESWAERAALDLAAFLARAVAPGEPGDGMGDTVESSGTGGKIRLWTVFRPATKLPPGKPLPEGNRPKNSPSRLLPAMSRIPPEMIVKV